MQILVVEDEPKIRDVLCAYFEKEAWHVDTTGNGDSALRKFRQRKYDLIILDLMIQGLPGEEVCKKIRESSTVPIIMITSKAKETDTIHGLNLGADDYITKPFRVKEVVARIKALQRRIQDSFDAGTQQNELRFNRGRLVVYLASKEVYVDGNLAKLTTTEFKVLSVLIKNPNKVYSRSDLSYEVQGYRYVGDGRSIDAHIKNVRKKIEEDPKDPQYIQTVIGSGYKFVYQPDDEQ